MHKQVQQPKLSINMHDPCGGSLATRGPFVTSGGPANGRNHEQGVEHSKTCTSYYWSYLWVAYMGLAKRRLYGSTRGALERRWCSRQLSAGKPETPHSLLFRAPDLSCLHPSPRLHSDRSKIMTWSYLALLGNVQRSVPERQTKC